MGTVADPGVEGHDFTFGFLRGANGMARLERAVARGASPVRVLVQYVPQSFGAKTMNVALCARLATLRRAELWVMFHEVALGWGPLRRWQRNGVAAVHRLMANMLLARADRVFVSIPGWNPMLRGMAPLWRGRATWLPIPSNIETEASDLATHAIRLRLSVPGGGKVLGHFGTYGPHIAPLLMHTLSELLFADMRRIALLVGRGSENFATGRVLATGDLDACGVAAHLRACDVLIQPYPDGVSSRRTSAMAGLALGVPIATNDGHLTEPVWKESGGVALSRSSGELARTANELLADATTAQAIAVRGRELYASLFSLTRTIERLRGMPVGATR
jgi:hypothetical protein